MVTTHYTWSSSTTFVRLERLLPLIPAASPSMVCKCKLCLLHPCVSAGHWRLLQGHAGKAAADGAGCRPADDAEGGDLCSDTAAAAASDCKAPTAMSAARSEDTSEQHRAVPCTDLPRACGHGLLCCCIQVSARSSAAACNVDAATPLIHAACCAKHRFASLCLDSVLSRWYLARMEWDSMHRVSLRASAPLCSAGLRGFLRITRSCLLALKHRMAVFCVDCAS